MTDSCPSQTTVFGIPNCDTVKKARAWLQAQGIAHVFHDFKKQGVPAQALAQWMASADAAKLLNRQGTTWRKLDAAAQAQAQDSAGLAALLQEHPSLIKRPVVQWAHGPVSVGFSEPAWQVLAAELAG